MTIHLKGQRINCHHVPAEIICLALAQYSLLSGTLAKFIVLYLQAELHVNLKFLSIFQENILYSLFTENSLFLYSLFALKMPKCAKIACFSGVLSLSLQPFCTTSVNHSFYSVTWLSFTLAQSVSCCYGNSVRFISKRVKHFLTIKMLSRPLYCLSYIYGSLQGRSELKHLEKHNG